MRGVTNLAKIYWPGPKLTKGDLLRYYAEVAPLILPAVADRPLVMKRFPNGINAPAFYQQRSRVEKPPAGVRIETLADDIDPISEPDAQRFIGGSIVTLLYMTQIAAISQDPWFSRVQSPLDADTAHRTLLDCTPLARARCGALGGTTRAAESARAEDLATRPAHLHSAAPEVVRVSPLCSADCRDVIATPIPGLPRERTVRLARR